jgi:tetratricopeptide (TPR) repeat protein
MVRYRRTPALIVVLVTAALGVGYVLAWDKVERLWKKAGDQDIASLEQKIEGGDKSAGTWLAYAEALVKAKEYGRAAAAYGEVIKADRGKKEAKFQRAICLALAGRGDELYDFLKEMVLIEPKLTMEILDRPETQKFGGEARFTALKNEARDQAMD